MKIYSIKDVKVGFSTPIYDHNDGTIIRGVQQAVNDKSRPTIYNEFVEDKELWCLGNFNQDTGEITETTPRFITKLSDLVVHTPVVEDKKE